MPASMTAGSVANSDKNCGPKTRSSPPRIAPCDEGICKADPISLQHTFFISGTPVLTDEACACSIEGKHDVVDQGVCICSGSISGNCDCIEGVDAGLYEQICNGKNSVLQTCGNTKKQYRFTGLWVKTELMQGYPAFVFSPEEVDHYQSSGLYTGRSHWQLPHLRRPYDRR